MKVTDMRDSCTYYVFILADGLYAIEIEKVEEFKVGYHKLIHPVTGFKSLLAGMLDSGIEEVPVLDISFILGLKKPSNRPEDDTIIIIETEINQQKKKCGLLVNTCLTAANILIQDMLTTSLYEPNIKKYFISNSFSNQNEMIKVLDIDSFWEILERENLRVREN